MDFLEFVDSNNLIGNGDTVYVISDMMGLAIKYRNNGRKLNLDDIISGLISRVGSEGNLLFPTFNWDFCKGIPFDYYKTQCKTGALSKAALKREDFQRTSHPLYSFAVQGKCAEAFVRVNDPKSFGPNTIFDMLTDLDAKALVIGIPALSGFTYIHHVEKMVGVPYRYEKNFTAEYTDCKGDTSTRTYSMYVRDLDMDPRHINGFEPLEKIMLENKVITKLWYGDVPVSCMKVRDTFEPIRKDICENDSKNMYVYNHKEPV